MSKNRPSLVERARVFALIRFKSARRTLENFLTPSTTFDTELQGAGLDFKTFMRARRAAPRQYAELGRAHLTKLKAREGARCERLIADAERILRHEFDLLGSGPFTPHDPDRSARADGYRPIDWYIDPVRKLRFPLRVPHKEWKLYEMRPENADIKFPWELSRCQHWPTLGQAWILCRDARFAREIINQLDDFMEANPTGLGVNWTCTMDVALRAANWCIALALILDAPLERTALKRAYAALFEHGQFIRANLENTYEVTSNHFLSNIVGLHFLAAEFMELPAAAAWGDFSRKALETEIDVQVLPDGADFESAIPYHRLVTELFMGSARLAALQQKPLSPHYHAVLAKMVDVLAGVMRPDGLMPVIGDADDGRLHIFSDQGSWNRQDARHLLGPASQLLNRPDWLSAAGADAVWETAWWGFDPDAIPETRGGPADLVKHFPDCGIAIARSGGNYLAITNGIVGTKGFGNHKHNELLGFELHISGAPVFVDTGSYVYTSDFAARNAFRSTAAHNTLMVDGVEQNEVNPEWIFRMFEKADPIHLEFAEHGGKVHYRGRHTGYARLEQPVVHERTFAFDPLSGTLEINDELSGEGTHTLEWSFHAAPGVALEIEAPGRVRIRTGDVSLLLTHDPRLDAAIEDSWVSPSYGVKHRANRVKLSWSGEISGHFTAAAAIGRE